MKTPGARRRSETTKRAILAAYVAGEKISYIAALHGVSLSYPAMLAERQGIPRRKPAEYARRAFTGASK